MKKIFALALIALFIMGGIAFAGPTGPGEAGDILGQGKYPHQAHRIFRLVHVSPNNNISAGVTEDSVVVWDDALDDGVSVETTSTSGDGRVAGILVTNVVSNDTSASSKTASDDAGLTANWGWLQTYGLAKDITVNHVSGIQVGHSVCAAATPGGTVSGFSANGSTTNAGILGSSLDTALADGTIDVFITCD
jgi:hypothetical protein